MRRLLLVLVSLAPLTGLSQPTETGPRWTTSATDAYLISAGSTAGAVGLGLALYHVLPAQEPSSDRFVPRDAALSLIVLGAFVGPTMGNVALGAVGDAERGLAIKGIGVSAGAVIALGSLVVIVGCLGGSACGGYVEALVVTGAVVAGAGFVAGTIYDLATIPRNAARAQADRRRVALRPAVGLRGGTPTVGLRARW